MGGIPNGQFILPREVIKAVCNNYVDMERSTIMESTQESWKVTVLSSLADLSNSNLPR
jgi:hypothetical protein